jgi:PIN domain nuclease of toxin-antitoxin system
MASCWEMAIKASLGKLRLARPVERFVSEQIAANGFTLLNIELRHTAKVEKLPFLHRDPFDRLLIAQAMAEKLTIVTADSAFSAYGVKVLW